MRINPTKIKRDTASFVIKPVPRTMVIKPVIKRKPKAIVNDILLEEFGPLHIFFNIDDKHFHLKYKDKNGKYSKRLNTWSYSFIKALAQALSKLTLLGIKDQVNVAPIPEEERVVR